MEKSTVYIGEIKDDCLILTIPLEEPTISKSGKAQIYSTTGGKFANVVCSNGEDMGISLTLCRRVSK